MKCNILNYYPFAGIVGQDKAKKALILAAINPRIKGVLLAGEKGTAKSTMVRSLAEVAEKILVNLPLNITEDRLVGSISLNKTIKSSKMHFEEGLLKEADQNILYIDEVNLLSNQIVNILIQCISQGENIVERDGISYLHDLNTLLVASMNPEEGLVKKQFLDKFDIYVEVKGESRLNYRKEIMKRRLAFEASPRLFREVYREENLKLKRRILVARKLVNNIVIEKESLELAASLAKIAGCHGHRAEISTIEVAKAICAYDNRTEIRDEDIKEAANYTLPHRLGKNINMEEVKEQEAENENLDDEREGKDSNNISKSNIEENTRDLEGKGSEKAVNEVEKLDRIGESYENIKIGDIKGGRKKTQGNGKRSKVKTDLKKGRYIKYKRPNGDMEDIAVDATLRIAAVKQKNRKSLGSNIVVKNEDIRVKIREKRVGASILFLVDASGSMGSRQRMKAVKGAIFSLLTDAYQKRDKVGLVAFRKDHAEVLLEITRSVELAKKNLEEMKTGGKTPLAHGLAKAYDILKTEKRKNPQVLQYLVLVSDGKGNIGYKTESPLDDALLMAEKINYEGVNTLVIDTQNGYIEYPFARQIAEKMEGEYVKLGNISKEEIKEKVNELVKY